MAYIMMSSNILVNNKRLTVKKIKSYARWRTHNFASSWLMVAFIGLHFRDKLFYKTILVSLQCVNAGRVLVP